MKVMGDTVVTKFVEYERRLGAEVVTKSSGSLQLTSSDWGRYTIVAPDGYGQSVTLPADATDPGQFVELHNSGYLPFAIAPFGGTTIDGDPTLLMQPGGRNKAFNSETNKWQWWGRRYQSESSRASYCQVTADYSETQLQAGAASVGDPPLYSSMTKVDFSAGTVTLDTNSIFRSATDDFEIPEDGYYVFDLELTLAGIGTSDSPALIAVGVNGGQEKLFLTTVPVARFEAVRRKFILQLSEGDVIEVRFSSVNVEAVETRGFSASLRQLGASHGVQEAATTEDVDWHLFGFDATTFNGAVAPFDEVDEAFDSNSLVTLDAVTNVGRFTIEAPPVSGEKYLFEFGLVYNFTDIWTDAQARWVFRDVATATAISGWLWQHGQFYIDQANAGDVCDMACLVAPSASTDYEVVRIGGARTADGYNLNRHGVLVRRIK